MFGHEIIPPLIISIRFGENNNGITQEKPLGNVPGRKISVNQKASKFFLVKQF